MLVHEDILHHLHNNTSTAIKLETRHYAQEHSMHCMSNQMKTIRGRLIYRPSTDQTVVTKVYRIVPVHEDLVDTICKRDSYDNKSQVNDFDTIHSIANDDQSNNYDDNGHIPFSDEDQYIQETVSTTLSLQSSLLVLIHEVILHHLHDDISTIVHVLPSLLMYQQNKILRSSLLKSLQSKFLQLSVLASLQYGFLQSSLLVSLRSTPIQTSTLLSLWNIFLRRLYNDVSTIIRVQVKPEIHSYTHLYKNISTVTSIHIKPEISKS